MSPPIAKKKPDAAVLIPTDELLMVEVVQACGNYSDSSAIECVNIDFLASRLLLGVSLYPNAESSSPFSSLHKRWNEEVDQLLLFNLSSEIA